MTGHTAVVPFPDVPDRDSARAAAAAYLTEGLTAQRLREACEKVAGAMDELTAEGHDAAPAASEPGDLNLDIRRLLDAGYSVAISRWEAPSIPAGADYYAEVTSGMGSTWRGFGEDPHEAIRGCWPLGDGPGKGGCGHCGTLGCEVTDCEVCAAYTSESGNGVCAVCGQGYPLADDDEGWDDEGDVDDFEEDESFGVPLGDGPLNLAKASEFIRDTIRVVEDGAVSPDGGVSS